MSSEVAPSVWIPSRTMAFVVPRGLTGVAVAVLATALCILSALFIYIYHRRRVQRGRSRRPKGVPPMPTSAVDAELIVDDYWPGSRTSSRRQLFWLLDLVFPNTQRPSLFPDAQRGGPSFSIAIDRLWSPPAQQPEPAGDDLPDMPPYNDGQANGAGPRFLATTASGKSLQVVVKTAAVASRQQQRQHEQTIGLSQEALQTSWSCQATLEIGGGASEAGAGRHVRLQSLSDAELPGMRSLPQDSERPEVMARMIASSGGSGRRARGLRGASVNGAVSHMIPGPHSIAPAAALDGSDTDTDTSTDHGMAGGRANTVDQLHTHHDAACFRSSEGGQMLLVNSLAAGHAEVGSRTGSAVSNPLGRGPEMDPAVAWYSRALHRQVSAAAAAAQAAAGTAKVHLA
ncbi:hypothetical protein VaNZ11_007458 [Volvox africanus]|uniref:Uncharacterized protein n=1 Tax=Volvox africanus TaxID=51714 RepID=A0ABQ5S3J0_9CHLO|nr:hypothetical protein VaNZ11_007458 [Volvox africanus]